MESEITFQFKRGTAEEWALSDRVLGPGEPGIESDTDKFKLGNGRSKWSELEYFIDKVAIEDLIESYLDNLETGIFPTQNQLDQVMVEHVNSPEPHPAYDDGIPFTLLYENAKV